MESQCVYFLPGFFPVCKVLQALAVVKLPTEEERTILRDNRYCTRGRFADCPLFRRAEQAFAAKKLQLNERASAAEKGSKGMK